MWFTAPKLELLQFTYQRLHDAMPKARNMTTITKQQALFALKKSIADADNGEFGIPVAHRAIRRFCAKNGIALEDLA